MKILVMRHGYAGQKIKDDDQADLDRELEPVGEEQVRNIAEWLKENDMVPDVIYASPVERTQQTAAIMANVLYGDSAEYKLDPNLSENKPIEMAVMARVCDESCEMPLLVSHSGNIDRLNYLKGDFKPDPDPMATAELRILKVKRKEAEVGKKGSAPSAPWKEKKRVLPNDVDEEQQNLY